MGSDCIGSSSLLIFLLCMLVGRLLDRKEHRCWLLDR